MEAGGGREESWLMVQIRVAMHPLETYLQELRAVRYSGAGVRETSYYPALSNLLNEIGKTLKPKVRCILQLQDTGAGLPDGGLFTEDQVRNDGGDLPIGAVPSRGAIEAKPASEDAWRIAESRQVKQYWSRYRQVLVTNYRDFVLVGADSDGNRIVLETYRLAGDERAFWQKAAQARTAAEQEGERFEGFLKRAMLYQAALERRKTWPGSWPRMRGRPSSESRPGKCPRSMESGRP